MYNTYINIIIYFFIFVFFNIFINTNKKIVNTSMENFNSIAEIDVAVLVSDIKLSDSDIDFDFANAPRVSILDLDKLQ
jgi:hypothetical protein